MSENAGKSAPLLVMANLMERAVSPLERPEAASAGDACALSAPPKQRADAQARPLVGLIHNPRSHRNKDGAQPLESIAHVTAAEPRSKEELEEALADFAARQVSILAISGGDGTVRDVLTRAAPLFATQLPRIVILPKGKTNALAVDIGLPKRWTLNEALRAARRGRIVRRRPLLVEPTCGTQRPAYGFLFGAGAFNAAIEAGQMAHRFGAFQSFAVGMTAGFGVLKTLLGIGDGPWRRRTPMRIFGGDGHALAGTQDARFITAFTALQNFPLGFRPFAGVQEQGPIRYYTIDEPRRRAIAMLPATALGWHGPALERNGMHRGAGHDFRIELEGAFILDGERFPPGSYRIHAGPEIRFVAP